MKYFIFFRAKLPAIIVPREDEDDDDDGDVVNSRDIKEEEIVQEMNDLK